MKLGATQFTKVMEVCLEYSEGCLKSEKFEMLFYIVDMVSFPEPKERFLKLILMSALMQIWKFEHY